MDQVKADHITSNFFYGCLPHILLGPFLNTLTQMKVESKIKIFMAPLNIISAKFFRCVLTQNKEI